MSKTKKLRSSWICINKAAYYPTLGTYTHTPRLKNSNLTIKIKGVTEKLPFSPYELVATQKKIKHVSKT